MSAVPLEFDVSASYPFPGLSWQEESELVRVTWDVLGLTLEHPRAEEETRKFRSWSDETEIVERLVPYQTLARQNPELKLFADRGFLLGNYAEFNVLEPWMGEEPTRRAWTKLGNCKASVGEVTPLF
jgi:hypothetical protein